METSRIRFIKRLKDDIEPLLKLHRLSIAAGMSVPHVINLLKIGNNNLREIEWIY